MNRDLINNKFYNTYANIFDKIPFDEVLRPLVLKYLPEASCDIDIL